MAQNLFNLPVGAKVKFGRHSVNGETPQEISWLIVAKNHQCTPAYPSNSVTLFAEKILDIRCYDEKEPAWGVGDRAQHGNNRYSLSNLDQWLNKDNAAGEWYAATHEYDAPPSDVTDTIKSPYTNRPGFLYHFTELEKKAILDTTIRVKKPTAYGGGDEDIVRKIFVPSREEIRVGDANIREGATWEKFLTTYATAQVTNQCASNSPSKPGTTYGTYWLRSPNPASTHAVTWYDSSEPMAYGVVVATRESGVRPALNLSATAVVSDTTDADGCYTLILNNAPSAPVTLNLPSTVYGGKTNNISWSAVTDPDGDAVTYELECSYDGGSFSRVYSGSSSSYSHNVTYGKTSIQYRVRALDNRDAYSGYTTSATVSVVNNRPPEITGGDSNLGVKTSGFTQEYTITDADDERVTIVEQIDGVQIRSYVATNTQWVTLGEDTVEFYEGGACPPWEDPDDWMGENCGNAKVEFETTPQATDIGKPVKISVNNLTSGKSYVLQTVFADEDYINRLIGTVGTTDKGDCSLTGYPTYDADYGGYQFFIYPHTTDSFNIKVEFETEVESGSDNELDTTKAFSVTGSTWLSLSNGVHTMTITATDSFGNTATKSYYFTKNVTSFMVENATPMLSSTMPTRMAISVYRNIPPEARFKVEVCNNGNDVSPTWEDATSSVEKHLAHVFSNTSKSASDWGVCIRVTVDRNGADGSCYVTAIGGNFE